MAMTEATGDHAAEVPTIDVPTSEPPRGAASTADVSDAPLDAPIDEASALGSAAALFRALGDPSRLTILQHLALGDHKVVELTDHLGLAQSTVSKHLACLRDCGLVESRAVGRASVYSVAHPGAVGAVLAAAQDLLARTGDAVVLCDTQRPPGGDPPPPVPTLGPTAEQTPPVTPASGRPSGAPAGAR